MRILLVEDNAKLSEVLVHALTVAGHTVTAVDDGQVALQLASSGEFHVLVLDLLLPGMHGLEVCRTLRCRNVTTPILIVSALDGVGDRIAGLRLGADDYLVKPFDLGEFLARIEALGRRPATIILQPRRSELGALVLDRETLDVTLAGTSLRLTMRELAILDLLLTAPAAVFSRERILDVVWSETSEPLTNVVDVYIARLRKKLGGTPGAPVIETMRGIGYRIIAEPVRATIPLNSRHS